MRLLWPSICGYESQKRVTKKPYLSFSVNPQPFALQYKHNHSTERHTSLNCASYVRLLFLNLIKSWCESPISRPVRIITQTLDRIRLCLEQDRRVAELRVTKNPDLSFSVNLQPFALQ